jgi:hypothetical protein
VKAIRSGRGLGDALYLQAVVRHLVKRDRAPLKVCCDWPDVFAPLGDMAHVVPFTRAGISVLAHYSARKGIAGSTQFEDCCIAAGIREPVEFRLDWQPKERELIHRLRRAGRPIVCVQLPRAPMGRTDGFGAELLPDCRVIQAAIDALKDRAQIVQVGSGVPLHRFKGIDVDLANQTSVAQLLDVASVADGFLGYCSFLLPLAESFDRPALMVWSSRGLRSGQMFVRRITPEKVIHKATTRAVVDNWPMAQVMERVDAFLR